MKTVVGRNVAYLSLVQVANYLFPLITVPYISRTIGVEKYGLVELALISVIYFTAIVDYSFDLVGTRDMARIRKSPEKINALFNTIFYAKLLLFSVATLLFLITLFTVPVFAENKMLFLSAFAINFSYVFYPNWFFQGLEKLGVVALANFFIKLVFVLLIFLLVKEPEDFYYVPLSNSIGYWVVAGVVFATAFRQGIPLHLTAPDFPKIFTALKDGSWLFISNLLNKVYALSGITIVGFLVSDFQLGLYGAANKLYMVLLSVMFYPLHGAVFPHLANLLATDKTAFFKGFVKLGKIIFLVYAAGLGILYALTPFVITLLFGPDFFGAIALFRGLIPALFMAIFIHLFSYQGLLNLKFDKWYLGLIGSFAFVAVIGYYFSTLHFEALGAVRFKSLMDVAMAITAGILFYKAWQKTKAL
ncbi:MAG: oligosaccharide flippase family protein [Schleiferiaceae bacterium]|nr:oligosaccharide flippase family protein [Schleiferiaceae bacterium]